MFQGLSLSTMLFDTTFNTSFDCIEVLKQEYGYTFPCVDLTKLVTGYADDIALFTETAVANQFIIVDVECWLNWTQTMKAKPRKCCATAMTNGKPCDPKLTINGLAVAWIKDNLFKFLGKQLLANVSDTAARKKVEKTVLDGVTKIDALPLTGVQKMWIFEAVVMSHLSWDFMVHDTWCMRDVQPHCYYVQVTT